MLYGLRKRLNPFDESKNILALLRRANVPRGSSILDVGCGYGEKLRLLREHGFEAVGVDIKEHAVESNRAAGFVCYTAPEFERRSDRFDCMLLSHVIEHFSPKDLLLFLDSYLDRLNPGGHLVIATPTLWAGFYADFDHVKPYTPEGLLNVFGEREAQVQYASRNRIRLVELRLRRREFSLSSESDSFLKLKAPRTAKLGRLGLRLAYVMSAGVLGKTDGWQGLFQKV